MHLGLPIAEGATAKVYLSDNNIMKVFNEYLPETESMYEASKQKFAYSCGLPVPKVLDVTKIDGKQAIIMEHIKGRTIGDILFEDMKKAEYYISISVDLQQKIHRISADSIEPMSVKLIRNIESADILDEKHKAALKNKMKKISFEKKLCHGDYHLFNLIMSGNNVSIIDWVDASTGDIRADVYRTYLLYSQYSTELADMYLRIYCEKSGLSKEEVFQWAPIIAGARLSEKLPSECSERLLEIVNHYCPY
ncbi:aminoglycoside phosphotransferase family protein [Heyndrickxia camelliae]|uniref:Aminoglycoside phosphotransferase n=1 Tax=Heyndrickxia camelliae TaxID=1707093 RepID=A0A2N3LDP4_9BACI|nr:aminoglycoside phosphotransferase family protein [Heyndrickxia camelliae]PKR82726.1 aminoglycoside phosphotransferase [Heyndrickxia camelliae]